MRESKNAFAYLYSWFVIHYSYVLESVIFGGVLILKVEKSVVIKKPIEEVFAYVQNNENYTKWQNGVISMHVDEGPDNVVGSRFTETRKLIGQEMKTTLEITTFIENIKWAAKVVKGPVYYEVSMTYTAVPEGTKITTFV